MKTIKMFIIFSLILIFIVMMCTLIFISKNEFHLKNLYPMTAVVCELNRENDIVTCKTCNGMLWEFTDCDDWDVGDIVSLLMYDNKTLIVYDDEIIMVRYGGYFE